MKLSLIHLKSSTPSISHMIYNILNTGFTSGEAIERDAFQIERIVHYFSTGSYAFYKL